LTTVNASAERARISDRPSADSVAWTNRPLQMPSVVTTPARRPRAMTLRMTSIVSAPGVTVRTAATAV
jgi:hypothetical protein